MCSLVQFLKQSGRDQLSIPHPHACTHTCVHTHTHRHACMQNAQWHMQTYATISHWQQVRAEVLGGLSVLRPTVREGSWLTHTHALTHMRTHTHFGTNRHSRGRVSRCFGFSQWPKRLTSFFLYFLFGVVDDCVSPSAPLPGRPTELSGPWQVSMSHHKNTSELTFYPTHFTGVDITLYFSISASSLALG